MTFDEACKAVINEQKNEYAKSYAAHGLCMVNKAEIRAQALYILNNLQSWRGNRAKEVKKALKAFT